MARRIVHFTLDEMIWGCNTCTSCECRQLGKVLWPRNEEELVRSPDIFTAQDTGG
jgi:hypothetical protein